MASAVTEQRERRNRNVMLIQPFLIPSLEEKSCSGAARNLEGTPHSLRSIQTVRNLLIVEQYVFISAERNIMYRQSPSLHHQPIHPLHHTIMSKQHHHDQRREGNRKDMKKKKEKAFPIHIHDSLHHPLCSHHVAVMPGRVSRHSDEEGEKEGRNRSNVMSQT